MDGNHFRISTDLNRKMQFDRMDMLYSVHRIIFKEAIPYNRKKSISRNFQKQFSSRKVIVRLGISAQIFSIFKNLDGVKLALDRSGSPENNFVKSDLFCIVDICYYL